MGQSLRLELEEVRNALIELYLDVKVRPQNDVRT
jgi:hypothetical protein